MYAKISLLSAFLFLIGNNVIDFFRPSTLNEKAQEIAQLRAMKKELSQEEFIDVLVHKIQRLAEIESNEKSSVEKMATAKSTLIISYFAVLAALQMLSPPEDADPHTE